MKLVYVIMVSIGVLVGVGYVVLHTRNLPLVIKEEPILVQDQLVSHSASVEKSSEMNRKEFIYLTMQAMKSLPKIRRFQSEEERKQLTVIAAAKVLDEVMQAEQKYPEFSKEAEDFYKECASASQIHSSARAICYWVLKRDVENKRNIGVWASREMKQFIEISEN
ncbi:MAG: hypothetical protein M9962_06805 [Oligoflexia bacterium]|nr:hypothetical protein [Oligoflexia bacterium]